MRSSPRSPKPITSKSRGFSRPKVRCLLPRARWRLLTLPLAHTHIGYKEAALAVSPDADHKYELALNLEKFDVALKLMREEIVPAGAKGAVSFFFFSSSPSLQPPRGIDELWHE